MKALLIDHDDSFTYNLRDWLSPAFSVEVRSHRDLEVDPPKPEQFELIALSPGPKAPLDYPHVKKFILESCHSKKVFGVCLGLQILNECAEGVSAPYSPPLHGKKSKLNVSDTSLRHFNGVQVARYHSLQCHFSKNGSFNVLAVSDDDHLPMWAEHREKYWMGFQFHPESFLTEKPELFLQQLVNWSRS